MKLCVRPFIHNFSINEKTPLFRSDVEVRSHGFPSSANSYKGNGESPLVMPIFCSVRQMPTRKSHQLKLKGGKSLNYLPKLAAMICYFMAQNKICHYSFLKQHELKMAWSTFTLSSANNDVQIVFQIQFVLTKTVIDWHLVLWGVPCFKGFRN